MVCNYLTRLSLSIMISELEIIHRLRLHIQTWDCYRHPVHENLRFMLVAWRFRKKLPLILIVHPFWFPPLNAHLGSLLWWKRFCLLLKILVLIWVISTFIIDSDENCLQEGLIGVSLDWMISSRLFYKWFEYVSEVWLGVGTKQCMETEWFMGNYFNRY